ncbi:MAG: hypothetical protein JEZ00_07155 [Anaerolineaceae bacterium]|nr:hypothetical protein [Anaerolineaceae bacterium]
MGTSLFSLEEHISDINLACAKRFALHASTLKEVQFWQKSFRHELAWLLGINNRNVPKTNDEILNSHDRGSYIEEKHSLRICESVSIPIYILMPKTKAPYQAILVFHGHDPSAQYCLGNYPDDDIARENLANDNNYAQVLAEKGYLVCVVEQRGLGERLTNQIDQENGRSCRHLAFSYLMHGRTLMGERIWDGMCAISYLNARKDVRGKLGCTGHSAGGATALWLSALDERIDVAVVSGYFNGFADSILAMQHCECNYVPGLTAVAEMGEIAALIAPRPVCFINGEQDELFPITGARKQFEIVQQAYNLFNTEETYQLQIHSDGHRYHHQMAHAWFSTWMN